MLTQQNFPALSIAYPIETRWSLDQLAVFDIETTGFSPNVSFVYLIGVLFFQEGHWQTLQWLARTCEEEAEILHAFTNFLSSRKTLLHFNGDTFDLPFLKKRMQLHKISCSFSHLESVDLYREFRPLKKWLKLSTMNLKSLETFLSVSRQDTMDGGQLISIYQEYCKSADLHSETLLFLHNHDDLLGTALLLPLFSYLDLFAGKFTVSSAPETELEKEPFSLIFTAKLALPLPQQISFSWDFGYLTAMENLMRLSIQGITGSLKYFFPDYKNYYYLPAEDTAIHKSVAAYVEKDYRRPAKASTCYCKKAGHFLPVYGNCPLPHLKQEYRDSASYWEYDQELLKNFDFLHHYIFSILSSIQ